MLAADAPEFADYLVVPKVDALQAAVAAVEPLAVLVPSSAEGKEVAARLALRIGPGILTDAVDVEAGGEGVVATQSVFAAAFTTPRARAESRASGTSASSLCSVSMCWASSLRLKSTRISGNRCTWERIACHAPSGRPWCAAV
ncbi:hypothetical protein RVR_1728 [Actinacidiphila reveromycinica]|uniref:Electron transfer flavoprotein alpha/beta-subunit N-terminal domain-containing protein n=1 Tax=Actinacidiphila reveromycinica TaxID=659352 RepID=A0A7U3VMC9_9ACTN|nr:hypothetical protein RVR_1728 [Streptomyces sp. SN-593]